MSDCEDVQILICNRPPSQIQVMDTENFMKNAPFQLSEEDKAVLCMPPEMFRPHTWDELKTIIAEGSMSILRRTPADMHRYLKWYQEVTRTHGSVAEYVLKEKLNWDMSVPPVMATPFANPSDYRIFRNDWPYSMTSNITHLVVWLKTRIQVHPADGSLTDASKELIQSFVENLFERDLGPASKARVLWFKQATQWQSVQALEHIHIIVRDVSEDQLERWTGQKAAELCCRN